jgi:hypothetical protein
MYAGIVTHADAELRLLPARRLLLSREAYISRVWKWRKDEPFCVLVTQFGWNVSKDIRYDTYCDSLLDRNVTSFYSDNSPLGGPVRRLFRSLIGGVLVALLVHTPALTAAPPPASAPAMGVILQAQRANVGNGAAAIGSTVFDGDLLQTDRDGMLRVRFGALQAALVAGGAVVVHQSADGFAANLTRGGVILSSGQGQKFSLLADGATIQPGTSRPTVAQVTWVSPKELLVMSRKGALQVSMGDETKTVADGASYRMLIDPAAAAASEPAPGAAPQNPPTTGNNKFVFVLIAAAVILVAVGVALVLESPSSPAPPTGLSAN